MAEKSPVAGYEFLDHPADIWVHAWGPKIENAFEQCVYALMQTMTDPTKIEPRLERTIEVEDDNKGSLLVAFLSEFLYLFDTEYLVVNNVRITGLELDSRGKWHLTAKVTGERFEQGRHFQDTEVKAITYSYFELDEKTDRTDIKIVYDI
jgi:SHS2 domain-containing protein